MIRISLLGPPRVERDGRLVAFDTRKAVALLAVLAVSDRPRARDTLADLLWSGGDPDLARGALRRTLSSLRTAIGPALVEATTDHVRLVKGPGVDVDVDRFRRRFDEGDWPGAVVLFRGDFLEGFGVRGAPEFEDWVQLEGDGLQRQLVAALGSLTRRQEEDEDLVGALATARRWLAADPLHEPAHRALIRLYAATGDRATALAQYRDCVRVLTQELGVPPLRETTELYEAVLGGSYPVAAPVPPPRSRPAPRAAGRDPAPLVGRNEDLAVLRAVHHQVGDEGGVAVVTGEAGIGKTRLVDELLDEVRDLGGRVLVGRAFEGETRLAYAPVIEALRRRLREGDDWLEGVDPRSRSEVAALLPAIAPPLTAPDRRPDRGPGAETRFLSAVWDVLGAAGRGVGPGVLLVDDVQWADDATLGLLAYGVRRPGVHPLLVVLTWRTPYDRPFGRTALTAARANGAVLQLDRLDRRAVADLVSAAPPVEGEPVDAGWLWERTEGVPLLVVEYLRVASTEVGGALPLGVRDLLRGRLDAVTETARQVLAAAAVLGRSFGLETVRAVSGRSEEEAVQALEETLAHGLLVEGATDYDFAHDLLRVVVYEDTSLARRRLLHGRAADLLGSAPATTARHLHLAGREVEAADAYRTAGDLARGVHANAEALEHLRSALALGHPERTGLRTAIGDLLIVTGRYAEATTVLEEAAAGAEPDQLAAVEQRLGRLQHRKGEFVLAQAHLRAALAATEHDPGRRAALTADLSLAAHAAGDAPTARRLAREAEDLAGAARDLATLGRTRNLLGLLAAADGDTDDALASLEGARELAERLGDRELLVAVLNNLSLTHAARHDLGRATDQALVALDLCVATGDRHHEAALHNNLADLLHASGRAEEAMAHLKAGVAIFAEIGAQEEPAAGIWKLVQW